MSTYSESRNQWSGTQLHHKQARFFIIWVWKSCCLVTGDHGSGRDFLSLIISQMCWAAVTQHIDGALDRSESGAKWQIKSSFPCESLLILLSTSSLSFSSWSFVPRLNKLPLSRGPSTLLFKLPFCHDLSLSLSLLLSLCQSSLYFYFHIPHLSESIAPSVCHFLSSPAWQLRDT